MTDRLIGALQHYAWGSRTAIPALLGTESDGRPVAELWLGAHPSAPSRLADGRRLDQVVADEPTRALGDAVLTRFGARLPFLLKVLAADAPLSIQAHPSREQAAAGFAREDADGIPSDAPHRVYRDAEHKPEMICALTRFEALCGFRPVARTAEILEGINAPTLVGIAAHLRAAPPDRALRTVLSSLLRLEGAERARVVASVVARCRSVAEQGGRHAGPASLCLRLAERHPDDPGVIVALLLNHVHLEAGQVLTLGPGNLHAYLGGVGVELMANSDNVLRGGLTTKHVAVEELLAAVDTTETEVPVLDPTAVSTAPDGDTVTWPSAAEEFALTRHRIHGTRTVELRGPAIALVVDGTLGWTDPSRTLTLDRGDAVWVPAADGAPVRLEGSATVFVASVPIAAAPG